MSFTCDWSAPDCLEFIANIPFDLSIENPVILTVSFSTTYPEPVYFKLKEIYTRENLRVFINNFKEKKL